DQLIVTKLDRLGCNAMDIRKTVEQLTETSISAIAREFKTSRQTILRAKAKLQTPDI
ncbi:helix-turn-helix domain-containing protein, partial [Escherichia coli]|uniref:helix-turn-helix domain-containing protein n=1 Tax=Escherichia coli TaxID=562 RepID=UPI00096746D4